MSYSAQKIVWPKLNLALLKVIGVNCAPNSFSKNSSDAVVSRIPWLNMIGWCLMSFMAWHSYGETGTVQSIRSSTDSRTMCLGNNPFRHCHMAHPAYSTAWGLSNLAWSLLIEASWKSFIVLRNQVVVTTGSIHVSVMVRSNNTGKLSVLSL